MLLPKSIGVPFCISWLATNVLPVPCVLVIVLTAMLALFEDTFDTQYPTLIKSVFGNGKLSADEYTIPIYNSGKKYGWHKRLGQNCKG